MKKKLFSIFLISAIPAYLFSISFNFHTFELRTSPNFAHNVYPVSLIYQFDFPIPDINENYSLELNFRIDNGLDFRTLKQDPNTGVPFASNPNSNEWNYPKAYNTIFNEMNLILGQGFLKSNFSKNPIFKLWISFDLRFENSYERFNFLQTPNEQEGLFLKSSKTATQNAVDRFPNSNWLGQPELYGDRTSTQTSFTFAFNIDLMKDKITRRDGMKYDFSFRLNPEWFDFQNDNTADYLFLHNKLQLSFTPFSIKMNGIRDTTWLSLVIDNIFTYRYIYGSKVPYYLQGGNIWEATALNTKHILTNRFALTLYGPQINSYDCYPFISTFIDFGVSIGSMLNSSENILYHDTVASVGLRCEFIIFNIANFYYEYGFVIDNVLNSEIGPKTSIGFSFGV